MLFQTADPSQMLKILHSMHSTRNRGLALGHVCEKLMFHDEKWLLAKSDPKPW